MNNIFNEGKSDDYTELEEAKNMDIEESDLVDNEDEEGLDE